MSAQPRLYRYDDTGAPTPSSRYNSLYEILKACLVDGYGSQPAAGWSMVYDNWATDGMATFTNAVQSGVLGLVAHTTSSYGCTLFVADAMVDATHAVTARSGSVLVANLPALANNTYDMNFSGYDNYRWPKWSVIANENVCFVWLSYTDTYLFTSPSSMSYNYLEVLAFGAARSLRGLGAMGTAAVGNFFLVAPHNNYLSQVLDGSGYGVYLADETGAVASGNRYTVIEPFCVASNYWSMGASVTDSIVELALRPAEIWSGTGSSQSYMLQQARLPMFLTDISIATQQGSMYTDRLSVLPLTEQITVGGKPCYVANLAENYRAVISMALEDWV